MKAVLAGASLSKFDCKLNCLSYNHENTPPEFRAALWLSESGIKRFLRETQKIDGLRECVLLCTCNRFELYFEGCPSAYGKRIRELIKRATVVNSLPGSSSYLKRGTEAVRHLFQVASGLRSVMLGENEILGQVKQAYRLACEAGTNGFFTNACFHRAFRCGKRVRHETDLNAGSAGYGAVAVEMAARDFGELKGREVLVIGTGELAESITRNLAARKPARLLVAGRSREKAEILATAHAGEAVEWGEIATLLNNADVVFSATAAPSFVIRPDMLEKPATPQPRYLYDLALPADIYPKLGEQPGVVLRTLSELQPAFDDLVARRENEVPRVERIVAETITEYQNWLKELPAVPAINRLEQRTEEIREQMVNESGNQPELEQFSRLLTKRLLRSVIEELKITARAAAAEGKGEEL